MLTIMQHVIRLIYSIRHLRIFLGLFVLSRAIGYVFLIADKNQPISVYAEQAAIAPLWVWAVVNAGIGLALMSTFCWRREMIGRAVAGAAFVVYSATTSSWIEAAALPAAAYTVVICVALFVEMTSIGLVDEP